MKKFPKLKIIVLVLTFAWLLPLALTSCKTDPPELDTVRDRFRQLIEDSAAINDIFFGEGLPTYDRDDPELSGMYYNVLFGYDRYEIVAEGSPYQTVEQIKEAAEAVYTMDYLEGVYIMAFDGYMDENTSDIATSRYLHTGEYFLRYSFGETDPFNLLPGRRIYLFDTMSIGALSTGEAVNLEISSYLEGDAANIHTETLRFVLVDGTWLLDEPTY